MTELEKAIVQQSCRYRDAASDLSNELERIEKSLVDLPGKVHATVEDPELIQHGISFSKYKGRWCLYSYGLSLTSDFHTLPLDEMGVEEKARIAKLIPPLLQQVRDNLIELSTKAEEAVKELQGVMK